MSIERFYTTTLTVTRKTWVDSDFTEDAVVGSFVGHVQQIGLEEQVGLKQAVTVSHRIWCAIGADVQVDDSVFDGTWSYNVRGIQTCNVGGNAHLEILAERDFEMSV